MEGWAWTKAHYNYFKYGFANQHLESLMLGQVQGIKVDKNIGHKQVYVEEHI